MATTTTQTNSTKRKDQARKAGKCQLCGTKTKGHSVVIDYDKGKVVKSAAGKAKAGHAFYCTDCADKKVKRYKWKLDRRGSAPAKRTRKAKAAKATTKASGRKAASPKKARKATTRKATPKGGAKAKRSTAKASSRKPAAKKAAKPAARKATAKATRAKKGTAKAKAAADPF